MTSHRIEKSVKIEKNVKVKSVMHRYDIYDIYVKYLLFGLAMQIYKNAWQSFVY